MITNKELEAFNIEIAIEKDKEHLISKLENLSERYLKAYCRVCGDNTRKLEMYYLNSIHMIDRLVKDVKQQGVI